MQWLRSPFRPTRVESRLERFPIDLSHVRLAAAPRRSVLAGPSWPQARATCSRSAPFSPLFEASHMTWTVLNRVSLVALLLVTFGSPLRTQAASEEAVDVAIKRGTKYLASWANAPSGVGVGSDSLITYAMLKGKQPKDSAPIQSMLERILKQHFTDEGFNHDLLGEPSIYIAGIDAMILADVDPVKYQPQLVQLRNFLLEMQLENGGYNYEGTGRVGDTSVTQYALLGLWAVRRAGIDVPEAPFARAARWHLETRQSDGGFAYRPNVGRYTTTLNMTVAGIGSLGICRRFLTLEEDEKKQERDELRERSKVLDPEAGDQPVDEPLEDIDVEAPPVRYGILVPIVEDEEEVLEEKPKVSEVKVELPEALKAKSGGSGPKMSKAALTSGMGPALGWLDKNFSVLPQATQHSAYYYYALERAGAMSERTTFKDLDWFDVCADQLLKTQQKDGSWFLGQSPTHDTAFIVLFLSRSTQQLVGKPKPKEGTFGGGLLAGGRGLPADLNDYGKPKKEERRVETPLEKLLGDLASADETALPSLQEKLVEEVQLGNHNALIGQSERLVELSKHRDAGIRRVAVWAMGRTGELALARHVLPMFEDPSPAVLTEVRNAMAWIARRPDAYGLAEIPPTDSGELRRWRDDAWKAWGNWYLDQSLYGGRLDEFELELRERLSYIR